MKHMGLKAILSSLLVAIFLLICASGVLLYFGKTGLILGFSRAFLLHFHAHLALLMLLLVSCHVVLNWRLFKRELKKLFKPGAESVEDHGADES